MIRLLCISLFTLILSVTSLSYAAAEISPAKLRMLYNSLDPHSISQHLALYELYPNTSEGQQALKQAYFLLSGESQHPFTVTESTPLPPSLTFSLQAIVGIVNKHPGDKQIDIGEKELASIEKLASRLPNRALKGHKLTSETDIQKLASHEIDLARAVLISQLGEDPDAMKKVRNYEAAIDLMALQILTRISLNDTPKAKIKAINHFIFEEMGFRFPPHSTYAKDVDLYTFLPSVLDSRRGVCLGVSILYICLAQRLNLDLEIVTPPGHIFVRWHKGKQTINIETTARGIHLPDEKYLGIDTRSLEQRNIKETIGMAHFNQASVFWEREDYDKAMASYIKAKPYLPEDKHLIELMGYIALLQGKEEKGKQLLNQIVNYIPECAVSKDTVAEDYLFGAVGPDGIKATFTHVDKTRESLLKKKEILLAALKKYPRFREGIFSLAGTWMQLHRAGEALNVLQNYHEIDPTNATVEYYLAALFAERLDYNNAWKHLHLAENLVHERQHHPEALADLRQELAELCPE